MPTFRHVVAVALILAGLLAATFPAAGQSPAPATAAEIQTRLQKSADLQRRALQGLTDPDRAARLIDDAYAELLGGLSVMVINASGMKYPDPLLEVSKKNGEEALALLQSARDALKVPPPSATSNEELSAPAASRAHLDAIRARLERALRLTGIVMVH